MEGVGWVFSSLALYHYDGDPSLWVKYDAFCHRVIPCLYVIMGSGKEVVLPVVHLRY